MYKKSMSYLVSAILKKIAMTTQATAPAINFQLFQFVTPR